MRHSLAIVLYGLDEVLIQTRKMILESEGHRVWLAFDLGTMEQLVEEQCVDLVVLCHSLSREQCHRALEITKKRVPHVETLVFALGRSGCLREHVSAVLHSMDGPLQLISTVNNIAGLYAPRAQAH